MSVLARKLCVKAVTLSALIWVLPSASAAQRPPGVDEVWLSLYLNDTKIGWAHSKSSDAGANRRTSHGVTQISAAMLGDDLQIRMETMATTDAKGKVQRYFSKTVSGGRTQTVLVVKDGDWLKIETEFTGQPAARRTIALRTDAPWLDNPIDILSGKPEEWSGRHKVYVFDPTIGDLIENEVIVHEPRTAGGKTLHKVEIRDPRASTFVFLNPDGSMDHAIGALGIRMVPRSEAEVKRPLTGAVIDLAHETKIRATGFPANPAAFEEIAVRFTNADLQNIPTDEQQRLEGSGTTWVVRRIPIRPDPKSATTIERAAKLAPDWIKPATFIPSDSARMKELAAEIVLDETNVITAALKLRAFIGSKIGYNAGIGVMRDAAEIFETGEGVCRDHAILFVTLLRAAGIPSRIAGGVVNWGTGFYYHAWVEVFDGEHWIGLDSTSDLEFVTPAHIKFGQGNVDQAFTFHFPIGAKAEVVESRRREPSRASQEATAPRR